MKAKQNISVSFKQKKSGEKWINSVTFYRATVLKEVSKIVSNSYQVIKNDSSDWFLKSFPGEDAENYSFISLISLGSKLVQSIIKNMGSRGVNKYDTLGQLLQREITPHQSIKM